MTKDDEMKERLARLGLKPKHGTEVEVTHGSSRGDPRNPIDANASAVEVSESTGTIRFTLFKDERILGRLALSAHEMSRIAMQLLEIASQVEGGTVQ